MVFELKLCASDGSVYEFKWSSVASYVLRSVLTGVACYYTYKYIERVVGSLDPSSKDRKQAELKAKLLLNKLGKDNIESLELTEYELNIASQLIVPKELPVTWNSIGGLDNIVDTIRDCVILPFQRQDLFSESKLFVPPKGILLYGPPGCGKTMLAQATAREANCTFINVELQQLTNKWYGESQKLAAAVFSLAIKLQPCIIFIDEIDVFLQMRSERDHEVTAMMKATFMSLWDGLVSSNNNQIMVMGATNRPQHIDQAILRRMPIRLHVPLPNANQRMKILELILSVETLDNDVDLNKLATGLNNFSGSDIDELCRYASVSRVHEHIKNKTENENLRPISMNDLEKAAHVMKRSKNTTNYMLTVDNDNFVDEQD